MIKATIKSLRGEKKVSIGESSIDKKDLTMVDPTASIGVVLWGALRKKYPDWIRRIFEELSVQELSVEDIELGVGEKDNNNVLYNCAQKTLLNVNQVGSC